MSLPNLPYLNIWSIICLGRQLDCSDTLHQRITVQAQFRHLGFQCLFCLICKKNILLSSFVGCFYDKHLDLSSFSYIHLCRLAPLLHQNVVQRNILEVQWIAGVCPRKGSFSRMTSITKSCLQKFKTCALYVYIDRPELKITGPRHEVQC